MQGKDGIGFNNGNLQRKENLERNWSSLDGRRSNGLDVERNWSLLEWRSRLGVEKNWSCL